MIRRLGTILIACFLSFVAAGGVASGATAVPTTAVGEYAYDAQIHVVPGNITAPERGPPPAGCEGTTYDAVDLPSNGTAARQEGPTPRGTCHHHDTTLLGQSDIGAVTTAWPNRVHNEDLSAIERTGVAAKGVSGLSADVVGLATRNITNSGDTVLGHFPGYITKANSKSASYFDIGDAWNGLTPSQRWAANTHFLDTRIAAGDRVLLSVSKGDIRPGSYLAQEVQYLTSNGYRWTNQWSLVPRG